MVTSLQGPRQSDLDSGFHAVDFWFQVLDSRLYQWNLDFLIPIVNGIPDSLNCIPDFPKPKIPDSTSKTFSESGIPIPLHVPSDLVGYTS